MAKKIKVFFLMIVLLFSMVAPAFATIGGEDAKTHCLEGDIVSEKKQEGQLFMPIGMGLAANTGMIYGPFAGIAIGAATAGLSAIANPENAIWENWPMDRWTFDHASPEGSWGLTSMASKAVAGTGDMIANLLFSATKTLTRLSINICVMAFHADIVSYMIGWITDGTKEIFDPSSDLVHLIISWGIFFLLVFAIFKLLKGQLASIVSSLLIAVIAVGGVYFYTANAKPIITEVSSAADGMTGIFLSAIGSFTSKGQQINAPDPLDRGLIACGQSAWNVIVAAPWAAAEFGTAKENDLILTQSEYDNMEKDDMDQSKLQPGMRIDTMYLGTIGPGRDHVIDILGRPSKSYASIAGIGIGPSQAIDHGSHDGTMVGLNANSTGNHILVAGCTLLPAIGFTILSIMVALPIVLAQFAIAILLLVLPGALMAAMIPVTGWNISTKYLKTLGSLFFIKLGFGIYLSLVLAIGTGFTMAVMNQL